MSSLQQKNETRYEGRALNSLVLGLLETDHQWRSIPNIYVSRYEEVIGNEPAEITIIADFLKIPAHRPMVAAIADALSYRGIQAIIGCVSEGDWIEATPTNIYHRHTLLHKNHLQGGYRSI